MLSKFHSVMKKCFSPLTVLFFIALAIFNTYMITLARHKTRPDVNT